MQERSGKFLGLGGLNLFYRVWEPAQVSGCLVLVHGAAEHVGRYEHVAAWFCKRGFAVWALDHRGHGQSDGLRMHVDRFDDYVRDLHTFVSLVTEAHGSPAMIGHSMGGLIAYRYAVAHPETITGLVLSSPWFLAKAKVNPIQKALAPLMSAIAPRLQLKAEIQTEHCTRNREMNERDRADQLLCKTATPRWYVECNQAAAACHTTAAFPAELPVLFAVAGADLLVDPGATRAVYDRITGANKQFQLFPEKYHEVFNDPGYEQVFDQVLQWLQKQGLDQRPAPALAQP